MRHSKNPRSTPPWLATMALLYATLTTINTRETQLDTTTTANVQTEDSHVSKVGNEGMGKKNASEFGSEEVNITQARDSENTGVGDKELNPEIEIEKREVDEALEYGFKAMQNLFELQEPLLYRMGFYLDQNDPASKVAKFGSSLNEKTQILSKFGYASVEASKKIATRYPEAASRHSAGLPPSLQSRIVPDENCPLQGRPRCPLIAHFYRTPDGTCNDFNKPWKGSAPLPMHRFLRPVYEDGIQSERLSVFGTQLPSPRKISTTLHVEKDREIRTVTSIFAQWGQFVDHDITSTAKTSAFNGSVPRCCLRDSTAPLPTKFLHPSCMPIEVPKDDWFFSKFKIKCMEFLRSAPSTRINCDLGWREQINQVTSYLDASTIYGSDQDTSDSIRTFRNGNIIYGRPRGQNLNPPDPPNGDLCRFGAVSSDCLQAGDPRADEQPGLVSMHTVFVRYHNKIADLLSKLNFHWSDEKVFQETRRIVGAAIQHITYREFLPVVVGPEVMNLFELSLKRDGYYQGYSKNIIPEIANSFSTAAFRFGHSMVQSSYVRTDVNHRPIFNNVSLHEEETNLENIWTFGSLDRLILGFCNQPAQRRDEFITEELTNHLFQAPGMPFGMDLAAINIQRGRDHGTPPYTFWREPCGLSEVRTWQDLEEIMNFDTVDKLRRLYLHVDDIDLYTGGLAEKPLRGGVVGPTFACIIAQQFLSLRKGDRFWYENGGFDSSFTPAQLQQIRHISLAQILCQTLTEIKTIQPFVFLSHDSFKNIRVACDSTTIRNFDLLPWIERVDDVDNDLKRESRQTKPCNRRKATRIKTQTTKRPTTTTTKKPTKTYLKIPVKNITTTTVTLENRYTDFNSIPKRPTFDSYGQTNSRPIEIYPNDDMTYLVDYVRPSKTTTTTKQPIQQPLEVNINIKYFGQTTTTKAPNKKKRPNFNNDLKRPPNVVVITKRPTTQRTTTRRHEDIGYPIFIQSNSYERPNYYQTTTYRPTYYNMYDYDKRTSTFRPTNHYYIDSTTRKTIHDSYYEYPTSKRPSFNQYVYNKPTYNKYDNIDDVYSQLVNENDRVDNIPKPNKIYSIGYVEKIEQPSKINDKLDFKSRLATRETKYDFDEDKYVKISSVKAGLILENREADNSDLEPQKIKKKTRKVRLVNLDVMPSQIRNDQWKVYNISTEQNSTLEMPNLINNTPCSDQIPRPMKLEK